jgi:glycerol uptake facilitator-like aquaporin
MIKYTMLPALIAEALGTFVFFSAILAWGEPIPVVVGLLAAIYAFGKVSGGHFNSAVSFMMFLKGDINVSKFVAYVIAQLLGATLALIWWKSTIAKTKKI